MPVATSKTRSASDGSESEMWLERRRSFDASFVRATSPYRAKVMASMSVDLPAPVGPSSRKSPDSSKAEKSTVCAPAKGPIPVMRSQRIFTACPFLEAAPTRPGRARAPVG